MRRRVGAGPEKGNSGWWRWVGLLGAALAVLATSCGGADPAPSPIEVGGASTAALRTAGVSEPEFIDLPFWSGFNLTVFWVEPLDECDESVPGVRVCDFEQEGELSATHLGLALDTEAGTITTYLDETCTRSDGLESNRTVIDAAGRMTTLWGDEAFFTIRHTYCGSVLPDIDSDLVNWVIHGGTGRFVDAYGIMSVRFWPGDEYVTVSTGNLRVRADLWQDLLPGPLPIVVKPGVAGVVEGSAGQIVVEVPVTLSFPTDAPVTVEWATLDTGAPGIATADVDYESAAGTTTFLPGDTSEVVSIAVNGDTEVEPALLYGEWGLIQFSDSSANATVTSELDGLGVFIIVDDD